MGAEYQFERIATADKEAAKVVFEKMQDDDRYENGHSYSGGWGMADGIEFRSEPSFADEDKAYEWIIDVAKKWEAAIAVPEIDEYGAHIGYFVGAWCSS
jgi:hypothetical protein